MSVVVDPSARETFTPRELTAAYDDFETRGPQTLDDEMGIKAGVYRFGERVLLVYEETDLVVLIHPTSYKKRSFRNPDSCITDNADHIAHGNRLRS
jgi:hypothetical protein